MILLQLPLISAVTSTMTFLLSLWIAWSLHRYVSHHADAKKKDGQDRER